MNALCGLLGVMSFAGLLLGHLAGSGARDVGAARAVSGQEIKTQGPAAVARELAVKTAAALGIGAEVAMTADARGASHEVARDVAAALSAANLLLVAKPSPDSARLHISCAENLQSLVCTGEIRKGGERIVVLASGPRLIEPDQAGALLSALVVTPVFAQRARILDVVEVGDRLLVLDANALTVYAESAKGWTPAGSQALTPARPWPRDLRGRLKLEGGRIDAFLPGLTCRGTIEPLAIECRPDDTLVWPVGMPGATLVPGRNFFTAPGTPAFFSAASLGDGPGAVQLVAGVDGRLHVFDGEVRRAQSGFGDGMASLASACGSGRQVIVALAVEGEDEGRDAVCACEMKDGVLTAVTAPASLPGTLTALWQGGDGRSVTAVVFNREAERYEAFSLALACSR